MISVTRSRTWAAVSGFHWLSLAFNVSSRASMAASNHHSTLPDHFLDHSFTVVALLAELRLFRQSPWHGRKTTDPGEDRSIGRDDSRPTGAARRRLSPRECGSST